MAAKTQRVRKTDLAHPSTPAALVGDLTKALVAAGILQHHGIDTLITTAASSDLATSKALAKAIADRFAAHASDATLHEAADATMGAANAAYTSTPALPADLTEVQNILNEAKAEFNLHIASVVYHRTKGGQSAGIAALTLVTTADATNQATADALANELKAAYNRHAQLGYSEWVID